MAATSRRWSGPAGSRCCSAPRSRSSLRRGPASTVDAATRWCCATSPRSTSPTPAPWVADDRRDARAGGAHPPRPVRGPHGGARWVRRRVRRRPSGGDGRSTTRPARVPGDQRGVHASRLPWSRPRRRADRARRPRILGRGEWPFLHHASDNDAARRVTRRSASSSAAQVVFAALGRAVARDAVNRAGSTPATRRRSHPTAHARGRDAPHDEPPERTDRVQRGRDRHEPEHVEHRVGGGRRLRAVGVAVHEPGGRDQRERPTASARSAPASTASSEAHDRHHDRGLDPGERDPGEAQRAAGEHPAQERGDDRPRSPHRPARREGASAAMHPTATIARRWSMPVSGCSAPSASPWR